MEQSGKYKKPKKQASSGLNVSNLEHQVENPAHLQEDYQYSSGIVERVGFVPLWLKAVYISLIVWAIYYIVRYWSGE